MRAYELNLQPYYLSEEELGIICSGLRELQNNPYISERAWEKAEELIIYFCEGE